MKWIKIKNNKAGRQAVHFHDSECMAKKEPHIACTLRRKFCSVTWNYDSIWPIRDEAKDGMSEISKIIDKFSLSWSAHGPSSGTVGKIQIEKADDFMNSLYLFLKENIKPVFDSEPWK